MSTRLSTQTRRYGPFTLLNAEQSRVFSEAALKTHFGPVFAFALTTPQRIPRLAVAGHQLGGRDGGRCSNAREIEWELALRGYETNSKPACHQAADVGAGAAEESTCDGKDVPPVQLSARHGGADFHDSLRSTDPFRTSSQRSSSQDGFSLRSRDLVDGGYAAGSCSSERTRSNCTS